MKVTKILLKQKIILKTILGVCAGIILGSILKSFTVQPWSKRSIMYLKFPGELFMRLVNCLILPLLISTIVSATCNLNKSGKIGLMVLYYYITTTILGITLSVILVQTIKPGEILKNQNIVSENSTRHFMTVDTILDLFRNLIPDNLVNACLSQYQTVLEIPENKSVPLTEWQIHYRNAPGTNVLGLVFFSIMLGLAIGKINEKGEPLKEFFHSLSEAMMKIMNWTIMIVPVSVLFLISAKILEVEDFGSIIQRLGVYMLTVFSGLIIQGFILIPSVYFMCTRQSPYKVISKLGPAFATAFGTSSSTATVPVTIACLESIGISSKITKFIVPIGATINMDGIALYENIGAIFIIQLHGLQYSLFRIIIISRRCFINNCNRLVCRSYKNHN
ncbi:excitatory amino acid transporter 3 isoform X2 [Augochlora pura]